MLQFSSSSNSTPMAVKIIKVSDNFMITLRSVGPYFLALQPAEPGQARIIILSFQTISYSEIYNTD